MLFKYSGNVLLHKKIGIDRGVSQLFKKKKYFVSTGPVVFGQEI